VAGVSWDPEEDFEAAMFGADRQGSWRASTGETVAQAAVLVVVGVPLVVAFEVARGVGRLLARARRWPMPRSVGGLTDGPPATFGLDGVPEPRVRFKREDVERVVSDARSRRN
jgi:hypothetical protein